MRSAERALESCRAALATIDLLEREYMANATARGEQLRAGLRKLAEYHPDRFTRAGEKIRRLATVEPQRINAAFQAISRARSAARRS